MLNGKLALFDVRDTEALAARALDDQLRSMGARLGELEHEDALAYLVSSIWEASTRFEPERSKCFEHYAYSLCRRRTIDWFRSRYRTRWTFSSYEYRRERPNLLSLDGPDGRELDAVEYGGESELAHSRVDLGRVFPR